MGTQGSWVVALGGSVEDCGLWTGMCVCRVFRGCDWLHRGFRIPSHFVIGRGIQWRGS